MAGEHEFDTLAHQQRLKAAVHYVVGQICEVNSEEFSVQYTKQFIAALAEATFKYAGTLATDLEAFAKHARRSTINADDVKLAVRKSPALHTHISEMASELLMESDRKKARSKKTTKKSTGAANKKQQPTEDNESDND